MSCSGRLQIPFEVFSPEIDEAPLANERPDATALRLAAAKARAVAAIYPDALVIGADQAAVLEGIQLGKPLNRINATRQLRTHTRKRSHVLYRSEPLQWPKAPHSDATCCFSGQIPQCHDRQIENYLRKEQPYHCAGSAKSEGLGIVLIERMVSDDPSALIGLPLIALVEMLTSEGIEIV